MIRHVTRADGDRYQVYCPRDGRKVYVGTYDSRRAAKEAEEDFRTTQRKIERGELPPSVDDKRTLRAAVVEWLASLENRRSRSYTQYDDRMNAYVLPTLGDVPISRMSKGHVMRWRDDLALRLAPATVNGALICLSSAFTYFVDRDWVPANPCHGVKHIESPDRDYLWIQSREEITRLLIECPKGIREMVAMALGTGLRLDELVHLQHTDISIERRLITVHRGKHGTTKTAKVRRIPILDSIVPLVRQLALNRDGSLLVFPGAKRKPRTKPGVRVPFKQAAKRAGLPDGVRFHDLRHTFASHWVLDGGDIFRLSKILGHSSVLVTQKTYAHLIPDAWEQDYHRVTFVMPEQGTVYGMTKRRSCTREQPNPDHAAM